MFSISRWLQSDETDRPFANCILCGKRLLEIGASWLVNKEFQNDECVIEYAICIPCRDEVGRGIDAESKEAVRRFIADEIDWDSRMQEFMMEADVAGRFDACIGCLEPREGLAGYGICALYDAEGDLTVGALPLLICNICTARMFSEISDSSRETLQKFRKAFLSGDVDLDTDLGFF